LKELVGTGVPVVESEEAGIPDAEVFRSCPGKCSRAGE